MNNLGKALVMAGFAFLFIVAATTSIYLYGNLNTFLNTSTETIGIKGRAEAGMQDASFTTRPITKSEIYITLFNLKQMHVWSIIVDGNAVTQDNFNAYKSTGSNDKMSTLLIHLKNLSNTQKFSY